MAVKNKKETGQRVSRCSYFSKPAEETREQMWGKKRTGLDVMLTGGQAAHVRADCSSVRVYKTSYGKRQHSSSSLTPQWLSNATQVLAHTGSGPGREACFDENGDRNLMVLLAVSLLCSAGQRSLINLTCMAFCYRARTPGPGKTGLFTKCQGGIASPHPTETHEARCFYLFAKSGGDGDVTAGDRHVQALLG